MIKILLSFSFLILIAITINGEQNDINEHLKITNLYKNAQNASQYFDLVEANSPDKKYFIRKDNKLSIILTNKKVIEFENKGTDPDIDVYHYFSFIKPLNCHLISFGHYEGGTYFLINNNTGEFIEIDDLPIISNNEKYFFTADFSGYSKNRIQIYSKNNKNILLDYSYQVENNNLNISNKRWISNTTFEITVEINKYDSKINKSIKSFSRIILSNINNRWNVRTESL